MKAHLGTYPRQSFGQEVGTSHPVFERSKRMFNGLSALLPDVRGFGTKVMMPACSQVLLKAAIRRGSPPYKAAQEIPWAVIVSETIDDRAAHAQATDQSLHSTFRLGEPLFLRALSNVQIHDVRGEFDLKHAPAPTPLPVLLRHTSLPELYARRTFPVDALPSSPGAHPMHRGDDLRRSRRRWD